MPKNARVSAKETATAWVFPDFPQRPHPKRRGKGKTHACGLSRFSLWGKHPPYLSIYRERYGENGENTQNGHGSSFISPNGLSPNSWGFRMYFM